MSTLYSAVIVRKAIAGDDAVAKLSQVFAATVLAPALEEIIYRGVLLAWAADRFSPGLAVTLFPPLLESCFTPFHTRPTLQRFECHRHSYLRLVGDRTHFACLKSAGIAVCLVAAAVSCLHTWQ